MLVKCFYAHIKRYRHYLDTCQMPVLRHISWKLKLEWVNKCKNAEYIATP